MFIHAVLWKFHPNADSEFHSRMNAYRDRIAREATGVLHLYFGSNVASRSDGLDHAMIGHFGSAADHDAYQACSAHREMKAYMQPFIARVVVLDAEIGEVTNQASVAS